MLLFFAFFRNKQKPKHTQKKTIHKVIKENNKDREESIIHIDICTYTRCVLLTEEEEEKEKRREE